ncbi:conserved Plasmodium protein, unknown function [Plasmodium relictum]|uniref:Uncharacterized protein n=1 Tax=Plasmodium relictum TaxID=85471 RepID=A0A1J1H9R6_PLARL|nr:conserved Plasmodium protein, unknown function [Plasmodium relictum]CRH01685.1 conserved Plasmodium protein, unknown function [Plasmodium relictum]
MHIFIYFTFLVHFLDQHTNNFSIKDSGLDRNNIFFSEPYHKIAGKENYQNYELNEVLAEQIYKNIKNNFNYIKDTQYNLLKKNIYQKDNLQVLLENKELRKKDKINSENLENKEDLLKTEFIKLSNTDTIPHLKTHNILKNNKNNIEIYHHIPSLNSESLTKFKSINQTEILDKKEEKMCDPRYNEYPPMNGFGYNHHNTSNGNGFYANTYNKEPANLTMQQHNMHGRNNLMFEDGNVPYGLYDQSNFSGTNSLMCGNVPPNEPKIMYRRNGMNEQPYNNYPMTNGMEYNYPVYGQQFNPNIRRNTMNGGYMHECHYANNANSAISKSACSSIIDKDHKKEMCRKNISKVKKGDIDINIETSSSNRKGVTIDLNIGVGN